MQLLSMIAFAAALSMDGFGVGIAYGMRKIKVPVSSLMIVSLTSATAIGISMYFGTIVAKYVSVKTAENLGSALLILIGLWIIFQSWPGKHHSQNQVSTNEHMDEQSGKTIAQFRIPLIGVIIQILREPTSADADKSGVITSREALLLGLALAMDALGAGFGAAMTGFKPLLTPIVVGMVKFIFVSVGVGLGQTYVATRLGGKASALPGWVLIFLGVARVMKI